MSSPWLTGGLWAFDYAFADYLPSLETGTFDVTIKNANHHENYTRVWGWKNGDLDLVVQEKELEPRPEPASPPPPPPPPPSRDPLSLDLDGDGVIGTLSLENGVHFDLDNSGFAEKTSWIDQEDGLLVLDKNDNGRIDGGAELFGTETLMQDDTLASNGYMALSEHDSNDDNQITQADDIYDRLKVWRDSNSNGVAEKEELKSLSELGIESIDVSYESNFTMDVNGVEHREDSIFTYMNGKTGITNTLWFDSDRVDSINVDIHHGSEITIDENLSGLPDIDGYGNVYSLHQAMQMDETGDLESLVRHFVAEPNNEIRIGLIEQIIQYWSGKQDVNAEGLGQGINAQYVGIMESFWGEAPATSMTRAEYIGIELRYEQFSDFVYTQLMKQTHDAFLYNQIEFSKNGNDVVADYTQLNNFMANTLQLVLEDGGKVNLEIYDRIVSLVSGINPYDTTNRYLQDFNNTFDQTMQERFDKDEYQFLKDALDKRYSFVGTPDADNIEIPINTELSNVLLLGGNDIAQGGAGADVIYGEAGNDDLSGGAGDDKLIGGIGDDLLNGQTGNDTLEGGLGNDNLIGGEGIDYLYGNEGDDQLAGNEGNDTLDGGDGNDTMIGGAGNDTYYVDSKDDVVTEQVNEGIDTVNSTTDYTLSDNTENLILNGNAVKGAGNSQANLIEGNSQPNYLEGKAGNDTLDGSTGGDTMIGGTGDDTYHVDSIEDIIIENADEGVDTVKSSIDYQLGRYTENLTLLGSAIIGEGNALENILIGNNKNNILNGQSGIDTMHGGYGDDTYYVDNINDVIVENDRAGEDIIITSVDYGLSQNVEELHLIDNAIKGVGNSQDNTIKGNGLDNTLEGKAGNDTLDGGVGSDTMIGGIGDDTYYVDSTLDVIIENADEGVDTVISAHNYDLTNTNIENLTLIGNAITAMGNKFNNTLIGNNQNNVLEGKAGNDILDGGAGIDTMIGGTGDDTYYIDNTEDTIVEEVNEGIDTVISNYDYELADKNLENLTLIDDAITGTGNDLDNMLVGNRQNNILNGGKGIDIMMGGNGDDVYYVDDIKDKVIEKADEGVDTIISTYNYDLTNTNVENLILTDNAITGIGNILNNSLKGNDQNNTLEGKSGNDILDGGKGIDTMIGGTGNDTYYIENIEDQVIEEADEGIDTIISTYDYDLTNTNVENLTLTDNAITGIGNDSENILLANSRNNVLDGGKGSDTMVGGAGNDTYYVDDINDRIVENSNEGTDLVKATTSYTLSNNIENLEMLEGATNGTGNGLDNRILGNDKDNTLTGKFGDDVYIGGKGDDVIVDNGGNNIITLAKGDGNDTIVLTSQESRAYSTSEYKNGYNWNYNKFAKVSNEIIFTDVQKSDVRFSLSEKNSVENSDLIIKYGESDSISIENFLRRPELNKITYSDGSFDSLEDIYNELTIELLGTDQEDDMAGHDSIKNIIYGQAGDDTITGGKNIDKIYGDEGDDSIIISDNDFAYGGLGNDSLSVNESFKAYLDGGLGYDKYNLGNSIGTRIIDVDFSGVINVNSDVTHIGYFENKVWDSGHGNFASIVPGLHNTELVSEIKTGEWTTEYKLKYTADTTRISEFVFDAISNSFVHHKVGTSFKTDFSEYQNGFDYFGFENISNYSDINNLREIDVSISGNTYQYKNLRDTKDYTILSTVISMDDFINQGAVKAVYTDNNDTIEGISNYQSFSFVANNFQDSGVYFPAQNFKNYYENDLEVPEDFGSEKLSGIIAGDIIVAEAGDDKINTGKGSSVVLAGSGNDYIIAPDIESIDVIYGQSGNDTIYMYDPTGTYSVENPRKYTDNRDIVFGGEGNDSIFFGESDNSVSRVYAGAGDDYIESLGHLGYVEGGEGNDIIKVQGNSNINAGSGEDEITIGSGSVIAGDGDDIITALDGGVTMDGEEGADTLIGGSGDDTFIVDKFDTYFEEGIDLEGGYDTIHIESDFDLSKNNFEAVTLLGTGDFNVLGDQFNNSIIGNDGNNSLNGQAGDDNLSGNDGNDLLVGGEGADIMSGGAGDDYYVVDQYETLISDDDRITLKFGDQVVEGTLSRDGFVQGDSGGNDTVEQWDDHRFYRQDDMGNWSDTGSYHHLQNNIENLILKGDAKTGFGNGLDNVITLNEQNNFVNGLGGNDTIIYQKGGGQDTINVSDSTFSTDTLVIQGYSQEQTSFTREQESLMIRFAGSDEYIWIADYFKEAVADTQLNQPDVNFLPVNDVDSVSLGDDTLVLLSNSPNGEGNLDSEIPLGESSSDDLLIDDQLTPMIDNKIDRIIFDSNGEQVVLTQQDIDAAIIDRADNHAPTVNKHAQAITINDDEALSVQFDADTIVDADAWDLSLSYRITLASQNADGSYQDIPDWLNFDADTRTLTGSPTVDNIGSYSFILWAGDLFGTSAGTYLTLTVNSSQPVDVPVETTPDNVVEGTDSSEQLLGTNGNDLINGYAGDDQIFGFAGNDTLNGGAGNDYLAGGNGSGNNSGNDIINGGAGDDTIFGEDGNDILSGGAGNDSYIYKANHGIDIIDNAGGGTDVIFFQQIDKTQLTYHKEGNNLIILVDGDLNQQVKVKDHFLGSDQAIDYIVASDGMMVSAQKIAGQLTALPESDNTDTGGNGDDDTTTPTPPTTPEEPTDNVDLSGDNTIKDTAGNDRLEGGRGNDTYIYTAGKDTIVDTHGIDEIIFSNGITFNQVGSGLMNSGNDLILRVNGDANNQVTIKDYFSNGDRIIETISFETGGSISHEQIFGLFGKAIPEATPVDNTTPNVPNNAGADIIGTDGNDQLQGTDVDNRLQGLIGNDQLDGELGNDILIGGIGNDFLKGNAGNDLYYFEAGFGQDIIDNTGGGIDNIYFDGVGFNDIASGLMRSNDDLILKVSGTTELC